MIQTWMATAGLAVIAVNLLLCTLRALKGPSHFDRVMAFDAIALNMVGATILLSILQRTNAFMDFVLIVALLGFLGTMALAAYLEGTLVD
jgi:multicomponent Na+:H+ antiporter subunit F